MGKDDDCHDWGPPDPAKKAGSRNDLKDPLLQGSVNTRLYDEGEGEDYTDPHKQDDEMAKQDRRSLCISMLTLALSIPALIGAWCWPALVIGLVSGTVTAAARKTGHWISFFITLTMMILVNSFIIYTRKHRYGSWFHVNGPLCFTLLAVPLIMADLMRHVLQDQGIWEECDRGDSVNGFIWDSDKCRWSSSQYHCTLMPPHCIPDKDENMGHLSMVGILFTIFFTYSGFVCLFIGVLWNASIVKKLKEIKSKWRELRGKESIIADV